MSSMALHSLDQPATGFGGPFDLSAPAAYRDWRQAKLAAQPADAGALVVPIADPGRLTVAEREALLANCARANVSLYRVDPACDGRATVQNLAAQLGLHRLDSNLCADEDAITPLQVSEQGPRLGYIPYSNRPLSWHTDGYYNRAEEQVRAVIMHCARDAEAGGESLFLDHEMVYLMLRDENPDFVAALMRPDVMTIPENRSGGVVLRPERTGPVFSVDSETGQLHMRYTARTRSIVWKDDPMVQAAAARLSALLERAPYIMCRRLAPGEGIVCNNVLHCRAAFRDGREHRRLLYRARFHDRVSASA